MTTGPGTLLAGRYRLEQLIGRGGMAEVYRGRDELLDRAVAVKLFRSETVDANDTAGQRRVETEMRTLAALHHPNLVTLYDASAGDEDSGHAPFLVMEFVAGPTLTRRLASGPLPPVEVAALGADLAAALEHVHANGVVHRDVKPANILLDERGGRVQAKLTDFGIARLTDGTRLTADGWTIGTANYLSPEQARGAPVGPSSDIYALGLVLIECLTGAVAFPGTGVEAAVARLSRPPQVPTAFGPGWTSLLTAMTAPDPAARPDAATVATALAAATDTAGSQPTTPLAAAAGATQPLQHAAPLAGAVIGAGTNLLPAERRRRRLALVVGALAVGGALIAVLAVALNGGAATSGVPRVSRTPAADTTSSSPTSRSSSPSSAAASPTTRPTPSPRPTSRTPPAPPPPPHGKPKDAHKHKGKPKPKPGRGPEGDGPPGQD